MITKSKGDAVNYLFPELVHELPGLFEEAGTVKIISHDSGNVTLDVRTKQPLKVVVGSRPTTKELRINSNTMHIDERSFPYPGLNLRVEHLPQDGDESIRISFSLAYFAANKTDLDLLGEKGMKEEIREQLKDLAQQMHEGWYYTLPSY
jgi:hypothetical protein